MTILDWIIISLVLIIVVPILAYLSVKWGMVGFYRGKEVYKRRIDVTTIDDKKRKYEKF